MAHSNHNDCATLKGMIGIIGGAFDPIHNGHLQMAHAIQQELLLESILFIPCKQSLYKHEKCIVASTNDRIQLLKLALHDYPHFMIDLCEIERDTPSYTLLTLQALQCRFPQKTLCFILGHDTFSTLPSWSHYEALWNYAHFIVVPRPGSRPHTHQHYSDPNYSKQLNELIKIHEANTLSDLQSQSSGLCYFSEYIPPDISSTYIRQCIAEYKSIETFLPCEVQGYIQSKNLYR
jgi:nicotinate-nucleotide adenylyltransferase